ncbi:MAG TPA: AMP-binding protein [Marmoricola sp.]|nr:AMP-binding protein [Marmoricola sp.]
MLEELATRAAREARRHAVMVATMARAGVIRPHHPLHLGQAGLSLLGWGLGLAGGISAQARLVPDRAFVVDELGELTWREVDERSTRLANSLRGLGVGEGDSVAVLCRNHRGFVEVSTALTKLGAHILYLNTAFAAPQVGEVCGRESTAAIVHDEEFGPLVDSAGIDVPRIVAWHEGGETPYPVVEDLIREGATDRPTPPTTASRPIILTSGTTGSPKGAPRGEADLDGAVALLTMPFREGGRTHIAAPMFHTWGWAHLALAMLLGSTVVLRRRFDPAEAVRVLREERCDAMIAIPVMLQRILQLPPDQRAGDWSALRVVAASGSALPGDLATEWMDAFGDNLYNTYGSTEVAWATIASPADMRAAPGTAGRPPHNTVVRLYDDDGRPTPPGGTGRIFVGNSMLFGGYSGGGHKEQIDGLMSTGDVGRFDEDGRLFVEGRDDEMIVSGGENVFPKEVEDCLTRHPAVVEAAAVGVDDPDFGKRLRAFVVRSGDVDDEELKELVKQNLARYKVPREIVFLDELPRNATGKVLKRELAEREE